MLLWSHWWPVCTTSKLPAIPFRLVAWTVRGEAL
jgi:hypothetical protein